MSAETANKTIESNRDVSRTKLVVSKLSKSFRLGGETISVLDDVDFSVDAGQSLAVIGPSGSGKSTLLHLLGGLDRPDSGTVRLGDREVTALSAAELPAFRNQSVGFIFQDHHLLPQLSVLDNVLLPVLAGRGTQPSDVDHARSLIDSMGLSDRVGHRPTQLSGGQRERVAIARALMMRPNLILADEPTGNLDRRTAERITDQLVSLPRQHQAILVVVTHDERLASAMDRSATLDAGKWVPVD